VCIPDSGNGWSVSIRITVRIGGVGCAGAGEILFTGGKCKSRGHCRQYDNFFHMIVLFSWAGKPAANRKDPKSVVFFKIL
jgi:hypothetical protein